MIEDRNETEATRFKRFQIEEENFKKKYQNFNTRLRAADAESTDESSISERGAHKRYTVRSTGATLTYSSAIAVIEHLCSLIPRDSYTPALQPKYTVEGPFSDVEDFQVTVQLPFAIPLPPEYQTIQGPRCPSKKEAKQAVAFMTGRILHKLGVLDDRLMPAKSRNGKII